MLIFEMIYFVQGDTQHWQDVCSKIWHNDYYEVFEVSGLNPGFWQIF